MTAEESTTAPPGRDLILREPHADRPGAEWLAGLNQLWRKLSSRREVPASDEEEILAEVFQRLPPKSAAACRAVCVRWTVLLSSLRLAPWHNVNGVGSAGSSARFPGLDGANARRRRRRGDTVPASAWFPPLPKRQYRRSKKKQGYRRMF